MSRHDLAVAPGTIPAPRGTPRRPPRPVPATAVAFVLLFVGTVAQRPVAAFYYDALIYWSGSAALFDRRSVAAEGWLHSRGALTPLVYAPAALVDRVFGAGGGAVVLAQNALMIAAAGALLLPRLARRLGARHPAALWVCAVLTWFVAARFARYPLMDVPAAVLFLAVLVLVAGGSGPALAAAGLTAGVTFNLRPAYLVPLLVVALGVLLRRRVRALAFAAAAPLGLVPQVWYDLSHGAGLSVTPPITAELVRLQLAYAPYVVRYDTVLTGGPPQQFYCDATMSRALGERTLTSTGQLVAFLTEHLPYSAAFLLKKLATAFAWSPATPYGLPAGPENPSAAVPVIAITVVGALALFLTARRHRHAHALLTGVALAGVCAAVATSTPETRFALPAVLLGIAGCALLPDLASAPGAWAAGRRWVAAAVALTVLVTGCAAWGLSGAMPRGVITARSCPLRQAQVVIVLDA